MTEEKSIIRRSVQSISRRNDLIERGLETAQQLSSEPALLTVANLLPPPFEWVEIPEGKVTLEIDGDDGYLLRRTTFEVGPFAIAKYPITNAQYAKFIDAGGYHEKKWWTAAGWRARTEGWEVASPNRFPTGNTWNEPVYWRESDFNQPDCPVVGVSWYEAVAFCRWISEISGERIVLPTEQQWQRAAQGDDGRKHPWGNDEPDSKRCNWGKKGIAGLVWNYRLGGRTTPVTQHVAGASPFGVMDMAGNVWEWCQTGWESGTESVDGTERRVHRGGAWHSDLGHLSVTYRSRHFPELRRFGLGFRIARL